MLTEHGASKMLGSSTLGAIKGNHFSQVFDFEKN